MNTADHILRNNRAVLQITFSAGVADGSVTVTVADAAGAVVSTGAATSVGAGVYTYALAPQTTVKNLTVTWAGSWGGVAQSIQSYAEVVGAYLFTLAQARMANRGALTSATDYPDTAIREARAGITDFFEEVCGVSFVPRYGRETLDSPSSYDLWLERTRPTRVLASSVDGTALTVGELGALVVYDTGRVYNPSWWSGSLARGVTVEYEHGYQQPPYDIHLAALVYLRQLLVASDIGDRTIAFTTELGTIRNAVAGSNYPTGIPVVDAALSRHMERSLIA